MHLADFFRWLNDLPWSIALREGDWAFGIIETFHILGLGLSVGTILWVDLRLMGLTMRRQRVSQVVAQFEPWAIAGFAIMFVSGSLLFFSEPLKCYEAISFRIKAVMLVLAGLNVWYFHAKVYPKVADWDQSPVMPLPAKLVGSLSIVLWFGIIVAGRWTAYL